MSYFWRDEKNKFHNLFSKKKVTKLWCILFKIISITDRGIQQCRNCKNLRPLPEIIKYILLRIISRIFLTFVFCKIFLMSFYNKQSVLKIVVQLKYIWLRNLNFAPLHWIVKLVTVKILIIEQRTIKFEDKQ